jgi:hypothetical protein
VGVLNLFGGTGVTGGKGREQGGWCQEGRIRVAWRYDNQAVSSGRDIPSECMY